jgi:hypothetical protein
MTFIDDKYAALGGARSFLGAPTINETPMADGIGRYRHFQGGSICWSLQTGAHEVHGAIREKWASLSWERGFLGYPTTDETATPDGVGRFNHFQGGSIYWTPQTGAHEVHGAIRQRWAALGWERSFLGYPLTDETAMPDGQARYNNFQNGSIRWTPAGGAQESRDRVSLLSAPGPLIGAGVVLSPGVVAAGLGIAPATISNGNFESGDLRGWSKEGNAFDGQPRDGSRMVRLTRRPPAVMPLGGAYWPGGFDYEALQACGHEGRFWISPADGRSGALTSDAFTIAQTANYISFLLGGHGKVSLYLQGAPVVIADPLGSPSAPSSPIPGFHWVKEALASGAELMQRVVWPVDPTWRGQQARIRIEVNASEGHINADDFQVSEKAPDTTPRVETERAADPPVWGFADLHAHPMSYLGFGGNFIWGHPDGPIDEALKWCTPAHGSGAQGWGGAAGNAFMAYTEGGPGHLEGGYPQFDGWPRWSTRVHQQMYIDWIRRAYDGGLRLMVALAVNNQLLAHEFGGSAYDDKTVVERELREMQAFVGRHADFMEIAYSPADARRIIGANKLAVILGVEVDTVGEARHEGDASDTDLQNYLTSLYNNLGVRHYFPIHLTNNPLGGTAVLSDTFNVLNRYMRDDYWQVGDASGTGVQFRLVEGEGPIEGWYRGLGVAITPYYDPPDYTRIPGGHANLLGLTRQGRVLIEHMMRLGMLIDVDHMSQAAINNTLELAESHDYPLVSGHSGFRELAWRRGETANVHKLATEMLLTAEQVQRIHRLGGLFGVGMHKGDTRGWGSQVVNDCAGSSKSWAQAYLYAIQQTGGQGVGLGTDINALLEMAEPRFGWNAAHALHEESLEDATRHGLRRAQVDAQTNGVRYNSPLIDFRNYRFEGVLEGDLPEYDGEGREIWQAIAVYTRGLNPWNGPVRDVNNEQISPKVENLAKGFFATDDAQLLRPPLPLDPTPLGILSEPAWEQRAAFLVKTGQRPTGNPERDPTRVRELHPKIAKLWERWQAMEGTNTPLTRSTAGRRDFDINIDGVAHYGLLPDFIQDLHNVGLSYADLGPLFRSAEDYIQVWEKCEARKGRI